METQRYKTIILLSILLGVLIPEVNSLQLKSTSITTSKQENEGSSRMDECIASIDTILDEEDIVENPTQVLLDYVFNYCGNHTQSSDNRLGIQEEIRPYFCFYTGFQLITQAVNIAKVNEGNDQVIQDQREQTVKSFCNLWMAGYEQRKKFMFNIYLVKDQSLFLEQCKIGYTYHYNEYGARFDELDMLQSKTVGEISYLEESNYCNTLWALFQVLRQQGKDSLYDSIKFSYALSIQNYIDAAEGNDYFNCEEWEARDPNFCLENYPWDSGRFALWTEEQVETLCGKVVLLLDKYQPLNYCAFTTSSIYQGYNQFIDKIILDIAKNDVFQVDVMEDFNQVMNWLEDSIDSHLLITREQAKGMEELEAIHQQIEEYQNQIDEMAQFLQGLEEFDQKLQIEEAIEDLKKIVRELRLKELSFERKVSKEAFQKKEDIVIQFINDLAAEDFYESWQDVVDFVELLVAEDSVSAFLEELVLLDKQLEVKSTREDVNELAKFILMVEIYDAQQSKEKVLAFIAELLYENTLAENKEAVLDFIDELLFDQDVDDIADFLTQLKQQEAEQEEQDKDKILEFVEGLAGDADTDAETVMDFIALISVKEFLEGVDECDQECIDEILAVIQELQQDQEAQVQAFIQDLQNQDMQEAKVQIIAFIEKLEKEEQVDKIKVENFLLKLKSKEQQDILKIKSFLDALIAEDQFSQDLKKVEKFVNKLVKEEDQLQLDLLYVDTFIQTLLLDDFDKELQIVLDFVQMIEEQECNDDTELDQLFDKLKQEADAAAAEDLDAATDEIEKLIIKDFITDLSDGANSEELHQFVNELKVSDLIDSLNLEDFLDAVEAKDTQYRKEEAINFVDQYILDDFMDELQVNDFVSGLQNEESEKSPKEKYYDTKKVLNFIACLDEEPNPEKLETLMSYEQIEDFIICFEESQGEDPLFKVVHCCSVDEDKEDVLGFLDYYEAEDVAKCADVAEDKDDILDFLDDIEEPKEEPSEMVSQEDEEAVLSFLNCLKTREQRDDLELFLDKLQVKEFIACVEEDGEDDLMVATVDCSQVQGEQSEVEDLLDQFQVDDLIDCLKVREDQEDVQNFLDKQMVGDLIDDLKEADSSTEAQSVAQVGKKRITKESTYLTQSVLKNKKMMQKEKEMEDLLFNFDDIKDY